MERSLSQTHPFSSMVYNLRRQLTNEELNRTKELQNARDTGKGTVVDTALKFIHSFSHEFVPLLREDATGQWRVK